MWIVILELTMNVKNLKIINTIEVTADALKLALNCIKLEKDLCEPTVPMNSW